MSKKKYKKLKKKYKNLKKSYKRLRNLNIINCKIIEILNASCQSNIPQVTINHKEDRTNNDIDKIDLGPGRKYNGIG